MKSRLLDISQVQVGQVWFKTGKRIEIVKVDHGSAYYYSPGPHGMFVGERLVGISLERMVTGKSGWTLKK